MTGPGPEGPVLTWPLSADSPQAWLATHLAAREDEPPGGAGGAVTLTEVLADGAAVLVAARDRIQLDGTPPPAAATYLAGWYAGAVADVVGFGLVAGGCGFLVEPDGIRWLLHPEGWPEHVEMTARAAVTADHPWAGRDDCEVVEGSVIVVERAVEALVAAVEPVIDACRGLAKVGRAGLWNEVADALGVTLVYQSLVAPTPERVAVLDAALRVPGAPWKARPRLGFVDSPVAGPVHVTQRGGCCLAHTRPPDPTDADGPDEAADPVQRAYDALFPPDPEGRYYCITCSLRPEEDSHARQVFWLEQEHLRREEEG